MKVSLTGGSGYVGPSDGPGAPAARSRGECPGAQRRFGAGAHQPGGRAWSTASAAGSSRRSSAHRCPWSGTVPLGTRPRFRHRRAVRAPAKSVYAGVSGQNVPLADIGSVLAAGIRSLVSPSPRPWPGRARSRRRSRWTSSWRRPGRGASWTPRHLDALRELRG